MGTGLAAAVLSVLQLLLAAVAVVGDDRATRADLFRAVDLVDVVKIACLAGLVAVCTTAAGAARPLPCWLRLLAVGLVPMLVVGSAALVVVSGALTAVLTVSLVGLLIWAAAVLVVVGRAAR